MSTRRVYPLRPASGTPGRTTYAQVQMRGLRQQECPEFVQDIAGPALLPEWRYIKGTVYLVSTNAGEFYANKPPQGNFIYSYGRWVDNLQYISYEVVEQEGINHGSGYELPAATYSADGRMTRCWVNIGELKRPLRLRAVLLGRAMSDVQWTAALDTPPLPSNFKRTLGELWPGGVDVEDEGHSLLIRVHPGKAGAGGGANGDPWAATLTMTASAGGKDAGTLELRLGWRQKRAAIAEQNDQYAMHDWEGWKPPDNEENV